LIGREKHRKGRGKPGHRYTQPTHDMHEKTTESRVADTILERTQEIKLNGQTYQVAPPTTATLILVSELVATLPAVKLDPGNVFSETILIAPECKPLGEIVAVLILGAKNIKQTKTVVKRRFFGLITETTEVTIDKQAELAHTILNELSPRELYELTTQLLTKMEIADFFALTTSLTEINLMKPTREVVKTTASGQ